MSAVWRAAMWALVLILAVCVVLFSWDLGRRYEENVAHEGNGQSIGSGQTNCQLCWTDGPGPVTVCWHRDGPEVCYQTGS